MCSQRWNNKNSVLFKFRMIRAREKNKTTKHNHGLITRSSDWIFVHYSIDNIASFANRRKIIVIIIQCGRYRKSKLFLIRLLDYNLCKNAKIIDAIIASRTRSIEVNGSTAKMFPEGQGNEETKSSIRVKAMSFVMGLETCIYSLVAHPVPVSLVRRVIHRRIASVRLYNGSFCRASATPHSYVRSYTRWRAFVCFPDEIRAHLRAFWASRGSRSTCKIVSSLRGTRTH